MLRKESSGALLVDPREAARMLGISARTLWSWTFEREPVLPHVRVGRLVRYSVADLERWVDAQRKGAER